MVCILGLDDVNELARLIGRYLNDDRRGEIMRSGVRISIVGEPNAGKSSFLNTMAGRKAAMVSPIAGTTRDIIQVNMNIGGYQVILSDMAGIRQDTECPIEKESVNMSKEMIISHSDFIIFMADISRTTLTQFIQWMDKNTSSSSLGNGKVRGNSGTMRSFILLNKIDLIDGNTLEGTISQWKSSLTLSWSFGQLVGVFGVSAKEETSIHPFTSSLCEALKTVFSFNSLLEMPSIITNERHRIHLEECHQYLAKASSQLKRMIENSSSPSEDIYLYPEEGLVLAGENLRLASQCLGKITGRISPEDVMDVLFRDFCIGK